MIRLMAALALGVWGLGWGFGASRAAAQSGELTEKLLSQTKFDYTKVKDKPVFKLLLEAQEGQVMVIVEEQSIGKDSKGNDMLSAFIWAEVLHTPANFKPPAAMLYKLAQANDGILFGSLGLVPHKDGTHSLYRNHRVLLKNCDGDELRAMVITVALGKLKYQKEFRGYLDSEGDR